MSHQLPALVTLLCVLLQIGTMVYVGRARGKYGVKAPAVSGHPGFEAALRIQMNTLESTAMFLPALWVFALVLNDYWAAGLGAVWLVGRVLYAFGYARAPEKRSAGFLIGLLALTGLLLGGFYGVIKLMLV